MFKYKVAFSVNGKEREVWFESALEYTGDPINQNQFREMAKLAVMEYLNEARSVPKTGKAEALAIWPEILPSKGVIEPLDAFEMTD